MPTPRRSGRKRTPVQKPAPTAGKRSARKKKAPAAAAAATPSDADKDGRTSSSRRTTSKQSAARRRRRISTERETVIRMDGDFVFKQRKKKAPAPPAPTEDGAGAGAGAGAGTSKEGKSLQSPRRRSARAATKRKAAVEAKEASPSKRARTSKSARSPKAKAALPAYPEGEDNLVTMEELGMDDSTPPAVVLQRFLETIATREVAKAKQVYKGQFAFAAAGVREVCNSFIKTLATETVIPSIQRLRDQPAEPQEHPRTLAARREEKTWLEYRKRISEEQQQWHTVKQQMLEREQQQQPQVQAMDVDPADPSTIPDFLSDADRELLSGCAAGVLSKSAPKLFKSIALQSDTVLSGLRNLRKRCDDAHQQHRTLADRINKDTMPVASTTVGAANAAAAVAGSAPPQPTGLPPIGSDHDPRAIISAMTAEPSA